ncbi:hypothetical protein [Hyunsoonleella pacifica]|uniref:Type 1 periplasmic binding fold superfamily protein n=1 Tax=Hyunsoonleella pacifica TaxID=1080224 RepID=A0A4Q9FQ78_9FLAO|nr:hypothetical protein [Hyunsoonleella pacifica]TBN17403.1 hypothetical protein EYD46_03555 [Hyunsoonleella pacifica]
MKTIKFYAMTVMAIAMLASCSDDDDTPEVVEEEEAITRIVLTFINQADANDTVVLTWDDTNGDEEVDDNEKTVVGEFTANGTYDAEIGLFNEDEDFLDEDILADQAGIDAHFFVYASTLDFTSMMRASDDYTRTDNNKLGVKTVWTAGAAGTGSISIELHHESPNVDDSTGFGTAAGDDTDIDISFNAEIQ